MSEARKCDRCHEFYEINPLVHNYMTIGVRTIIGTSGKSYDLCPNCVELLDKWLENPDNWTPEQETFLKLLDYKVKHPDWRKE